MSSAEVQVTIDQLKRALKQTVKAVVVDGVFGKWKSLHFYLCGGDQSWLAGNGKSPTPVLFELLNAGGEENDLGCQIFDAQVKFARGGFVEFERFVDVRSDFSHGCNGVTEVGLWKKGRQLSRH